MRKALFFFPLLAAATAGCAGSGAEPQGGQSELSRALAGRTAGPPQNCVPIESGRSLTVIERGQILYGSGRTIWRAQLRDSCPSLRRLDTLIVEPMGSQYCRGDHVRSVLPGSTIPGPVCVIESFVPYTLSD
jgi:hypothetical protein